MFDFMHEISKCLLLQILALFFVNSLCILAIKVGDYLHQKITPVGVNLCLW